jgi:hypothetical protein
LQMNVFIDWALGIEAVVRWWEAQENSGGEEDDRRGRGRTQCICDAVAGGADHSTGLR